MSEEEVYYLNEQIKTMYKTLELIFTSENSVLCLSSSEMLKLDIIKTCFLDDLNAIEITSDWDFGKASNVVFDIFTKYVFPKGEDGLCHV